MSTHVPPQIPVPIPPPQRGKLSGAAIVSLALGVCGFITMGLAGMAGIIVGIVALVSINRSGGRVRGAGLAAAGITVSAFSLFTGCILGVGLMLPALGVARQSAIAARTSAMLSAAGRAVDAYAMDYKDHLPPADDWQKALQNYGDPQALLLSGPGGAPRAFAMNAGLAGKRRGDVGDPGNTVLLFEAAPGSPSSGSSELLPARPASRRGYMILFVDGSVRNVPRPEIGSLTWKP